MSFTVIWRPKAEERLAQLWPDAADRPAVTAAADAIDGDLRRDPIAVGESRFESTRILVHEPLAVYYDLSEDDRLVTVWAVWRVT